MHLLGLTSSYMRLGYPGVIHAYTCIYTFLCVNVSPVVPNIRSLYPLFSSVYNLFLM